MIDSGNKYIFDLNDAVEQFYTDFSNNKDYSFFIDTDKHASTNDLLNDNYRLINFLDIWEDKNNKNFNREDLDDCMEDNNLNPNMQSHTYLLYEENDSPKQVSNFILFSQKFIESFYSSFDSAPASEEDMNIYCETMLNHEIGHGLFDGFIIQAALDKISVNTSEIKNNAKGFPKLSDKRKEELGKASLSESVAESYALIRMHQSCGLEHKAAKRWIATRTLDRIKYPTDTHNFVPAIHAVVKAAKNGELNGLSPEDSFMKACTIGIANVLSSDNILTIGHELKDAYNDAKDSKWHKAIKKIRKVVKTTSSLATLNDVQYVVQSIEDIPSYPKKLKSMLNKVWDDMAENKTIHKHGYLKQEWRANKDKSVYRPNLRCSLKNKPKF